MAWPVDGSAPAGKEAVKAAKRPACRVALMAREGSCGKLQKQAAYDTPTNFAPGLCVLVGHRRRFAPEYVLWGRELRLCFAKSYRSLPHCV